MISDINFYIQRQADT